MEAGCNTLCAGSQGFSVHRTRPQSGLPGEATLEAGSNWGVTVPTDLKALAAKSHSSAFSYFFLGYKLLPCNAISGGAFQRFPSA